MWQDSLCVVRRRSRRTRLPSRKRYGAPGRTRTCGLLLRRPTVPSYLRETGIISSGERRVVQGGGLEPVEPGASTTRRTESYSSHHRRQLAEPNGIREFVSGAPDVVDLERAHSSSINSHGQSEVVMIANGEAGLPLAELVRKHGIPGPRSTRARSLRHASTYRRRDGSAQNLRRLFTNATFNPARRRSTCSGGRRR